MTVWIFVILVISVFSCSVFLDAVSVLPRVAGSIVGLNAIAYSVQVIVNTIKRVFIVTYPPLVGVIALADDLELLLTAIFLSYAVSIVPLFACILFREKIVYYFCDLLSLYHSDGRLFASILKARPRPAPDAQTIDNKLFQKRTLSLARRDIAPRVFFVAAWIFVFYGSSMFLINLIAFRFQDASTVVLQLTGFINACGTVVLAFYLDPMLSRKYEIGENLHETLNSLLLAHVANVALLGPLIIAVATAILYL
ncbi:hypothetical protein K1T73_17375 [Roseovarius sp. SCSIO 43702]|uniref:hypothetical protein n=1 Tax=Roseovarius sp. SCSIO 43702 TaxID=2823043 RepID=UPI001C73938D|nr:hypothetical protein [Roseovarius sp. SCSIO 43702]QYX56779.1 hypothetical protein K1T73_17375 [Roseovarius sp. SCSIO 43702]